MAYDSNACTCVKNGDAYHIGDPMPWIGRYVTFASLVCTVAMVSDVIRSFTRKKLWIPSKFFVLNATFLTILSIATKIPNDVNDSKAGWFDQLARLSGVALICISMSHAMPSLSAMDGSTLSNMVALGILVVSTAVNNVWFHIYNEQIFVLVSPNLMATVIMLFMYLILVSHSLTAAGIKEIQEKRYIAKHKELLREVESGGSPIIPTERLRKYVMKYWLMALTASPDYLLLSSGMSSTNITLQWLVSLLALIELPICIQQREDSYMESEYKDSIIVIVIIQTIAVSVGFLSSLMRLVQSTLHSFGTFESMLFIEKYRLQKIREWKADPLPFHVKSKGASVLVHRVKDLALGLLILFQRLMAVLTRAYLFVLFDVVLFVPFTLPLLALHRLFLRRSSDEAEDEYLCGYVLTLEGGGENAKATAKRWKNHPDLNWIRSGQRRSPKHLHSVLATRHLLQHGRPGLAQILADGVRTMAIDDRLLQRSWSLQLMTLASIVQAMFRGSDHDHSSKKLMEAIDEGFQYWNLVDKNHAKVSNKALKAAKMVRERLMVRDRWLDVRLARTPGQTAKGVVRDLEVWATDYVRRYEKLDRAEWSLEAVAAKSMSRITQVMLEWKIGFTFDELEAEVVGLMESCLAGLSHAIFYECSEGSYGSREEHVRLAALFLGETKEILELLEGRDGVAATAP